MTSKQPKSKKIVKQESSEEEETELLVKETDQSDKEKPSKAKKNATKKIDPSKLKKDTRLIPIAEWDWTRVVYSSPQKKDIPDGSGSFRRVNIQYMYDDETIGPAIVGLTRHFCFGVQPNNTDKDGVVIIDKQTGKPKPLSGYKMAHVLTSQSKENPDSISPEEQFEVDHFDEWRAELIRYSIEHKKDIGKGAKSDSQIEGMVGELLHRKKDAEGNLVENTAPTLYANLIYYPNKKQVGTNFYGPGDKTVNPLSMKQFFYATTNIHLDNIYIGGKSISLQHRVYDSTVEPSSKGPAKRLAKENTTVPTECDEVEEGEEAEEASTENVNDMLESENEEDE